MIKNEHSNSKRSESQASTTRALCATTFTAVAVGHPTMRSMSLSFNVDYSTAFPTSLVYILRRADTMDEENRTDHKKDTIN